MKKELILNESVLATAFLEAAIKTVQKYVIMFEKTGTQIEPQFALAELHKGLMAAQELATGLSPRNFLVPEIRRQRRAIRRGKKVMA